MTRCLFGRFVPSQSRWTACGPSWDTQRYRRCYFSGQTLQPQYGSSRTATAGRKASSLSVFPTKPHQSPYTAGMYAAVPVTTEKSVTNFCVSSELGWGTLERVNLMKIDFCHIVNWKCLQSPEFWFSVRTLLNKNIAKVLFVEESESGQKIRKYVVKKTNPCLVLLNKLSPLRFVLPWELLPHSSSVSS